MDYKICLFLYILLFLTCSCNLNFGHETQYYEFFAGEKELLLESQNFKSKFDLLVNLRGDEIPLNGSCQLVFQLDNVDWVVDIENRKIELIAQIEDETLEGKYYTYYENGNTRSIGFYKNEKKHGDWMQFHTNGVQINSGKYNNDEQVGEWYYYDTLKLFREERNYINQREYLFLSFDSLDRKNQSGGYMNGSPNGKWIEYDTLGRTLIELNYKAGKYQDSLIIYEEGKKRIFQIYEEGKVIKEGFINEEKLK